MLTAKSVYESTTKCLFYNILCSVNEHLPLRKCTIIAKESTIEALEQTQEGQ